MPESEPGHRRHLGIKTSLNRIPNGYLARIFYIIIFAATATSIGRCYFEQQPKSVLEPATLSPQPSPTPDCYALSEGDDYKRQCFMDQGIIKP